MGVHMESVRPNALYATQRTISGTFCDGSSVDHDISDVAKVPTVVAVKSGDHLTTFNNRRLYAYRRMQLKEVDTLVVDATHQLTAYNKDDYRQPQNADFRHPEQFGKNAAHRLRLIKVHVGFVHESLLYVISWPVYTASQLCHGLCLSQDNSFPLTGSKDTPSVSTDLRETTYLVRELAQPPLTYQEAAEKLLENHSFFITLNLDEEIAEDGLTRFNAKNKTTETQEYLRQCVLPQSTQRLAVYTTTNNIFKGRLLNILNKSCNAYNTASQSDQSSPKLDSQTEFPPLGKGGVAASSAGRKGTKPATDEELEANVSALIYEDFQVPDDDDFVRIWGREDVQAGPEFLVRDFGELHSLPEGGFFKATLAEMRAFERQREAALYDENFVFSPIVQKVVLETICNSNFAAFSFSVWNATSRQSASKETCEALVHNCRLEGQLLQNNPRYATESTLVGESIVLVVADRKNKMTSLNVQREIRVPYDGQEFLLRLEDQDACPEIAADGPNSDLDYIPSDEDLYAKSEVNDRPTQAVSNAANRPLKIEHLTFRFRRLGTSIDVNLPVETTIQDAPKFQCLGVISRKTRRCRRTNQTIPKFFCCHHKAQQDVYEAGLRDGFKENDLSWWKPNAS